MAIKLKVTDFIDNYYTIICMFCLFDLILYIPVNNFSFMSEPVLSKDKCVTQCLAQGHNVRLKSAAPQSRVKHSTTEPLCSLNHNM